MKNQIRFIAILMVLVFMALMMGGCKRPDVNNAHSIGGNSYAGDDPVLSSTPLAVVELTEGVSYDDDWPTLSPDAEFCAKQMDFSLELFRRAAKKSRCKNTLIAPISVSMALAMAANGAEGKTAEEMLRVLGGHSMDALNSYLGNWQLNLMSDEKATLRMGNSIWIRDLDGFEVKEKFLQDNAKFYHSQVFKAPFNSIGMEKMNEWVKEKTDGMIPQLIGELNDETLMVLINALAFDAQWQDPYTDYHIHKETFRPLKGKNQSAQMMYSTESTYLEGEGAIGFLRPYLGGRYAFGALLPEEGNFETYVENLTGEKLLEILENQQKTQVHARLPQFKNEYHLSMNELLKEMGMPLAFDGGFGKMSNEDLYISEVLHQAVIEVNEDGTRASAATAVMLEKATSPMAEPKEVILDRPFVYFIIDTQTNLPIFLGTVTSL